jgi:long-chain acyl-CoA synthetase
VVKFTAKTMNNSFCQLIVDAAESHADKIAMEVVGVPESRYTFAETLDRVRSIAYRLEKEEINFGDRVALIGENHPRWAICYLGTLYRGAVVVPIDPNGEIETITNFFSNSEARMAFIGEEFLEKFGQIEERLGKKIPAVILQDTNLTNGFQSFSDWSSTPRPAEFDAQAPPAKGDHLAQLTYTSGTTGTPKGVPLTHGNIFAETTGVQEVMNIKETEVILSVLPLFHVFAQVALWIAATIGAKVMYLKELGPAELEKAFQTKEVTLLTGVPRLWYLFHKKIFDGVAAQPKPVQALFRVLLKTNGFLRDTFKINLGKKFFGKIHDAFGGKLNITISAGSRFDEKVARDYHSLGFTIIQGYGLTETTGAVTATRFEDNVVGSVGTPVKFAEVKIGEPDAEGVGEVLIRGAMVFKGYYKNEEATREAFTEDGWFRSGDLGKFDKNGHLFIVGRSKDVIVLPSGKNIYPEDLEAHYAKCPFVGEICVLGVADETSKLAGAEKLIAVVVPDFEYMRANNVANAREWIRHELDSLGRELPEYQRVRDYIVRAEPLPRTATRKIRRFEVQKALAAGIGDEVNELKSAKQWVLTEEDKALLDSNAGRAVVSAIKSNAPDAELIHPEMNLEIDLGLDSLARAEVFAILETAFATEFGADEAARAFTVKDAVELTQKHAGDAETSEEITAHANWGKIVRQADENAPELKPVLRRKPLFMPFAFLVYKSFYFFCKIALRLEVTGAENLSKIKRPFLICPNHQSFLDPFVVASIYPYEVFRNSFAVGASQFFKNRLMKYIADMLSVVPIDPDTQLMRAMRASAGGLKSGKILNIYPEGARAFDGNLHEFKKGAAILATELDLPIIPVALDGLYKVWARNSSKIRFSKVKVHFGEPFYPGEIITPEMSDEEKYAVVSRHLMETIRKEIEEMRGEKVKPVA